jgi:hypothetical protein
MAILRSLVIPFGRIYPIREDLDLATKTEAEGGTGGTLKFWEWTEAKVREYLATINKEIVLNT